MSATATPANLTLLLYAIKGCEPLASTFFCNSYSLCCAHRLLCGREHECVTSPQRVSGCMLLLLQFASVCVWGGEDVGLLDSRAH